MNELMFTGWQVVGCALMCLAAGIGIGAVGLRLIELVRLPDCAICGKARRLTVRTGASLTDATTGN